MLRATIFLLLLVIAAAQSCAFSIAGRSDAAVLKVVANNAAGSSTPSASVTCPTAVPAVTIAAATSTSATVSWSALAGASSYIVERVSPLPVQQVASTASTSTTVSGIAVGSTYTLRVYGTCSTGGAGPATNATFTYAGATAFSATALSSSVVRVSWTLTYPTTVTVLRGGAVVASYAAGTTEHYDEGMSPSTSYSYGLQLAPQTGYVYYAPSSVSTSTSALQSFSASTGRGANRKAVVSSDGTVAVVPVGTVLVFYKKVGTTWSQVATYSDAYTIREASISSDGTRVYFVVQSSTTGRRLLAFTNAGRILTFDKSANTVALSLSISYTGSGSYGGCAGAMSADGNTVFSGGANGQTIYAYTWSGSAYSATASQADSYIPLSNSGIMSRVTRAGTNGMFAYANPAASTVRINTYSAGAFGTALTLTVGAAVGDIAMSVNGTRLAILGNSNVYIEWWSVESGTWTLLASRNDADYTSARSISIDPTSMRIYVACYASGTPYIASYKYVEVGGTKALVRTAVVPVASGLTIDTTSNLDSMSVSAPTNWHNPIAFVRTGSTTSTIAMV